MSEQNLKLSQDEWYPFYTAALESISVLKKQLEEKQTQIVALQDELGLEMRQSENLASALQRSLDCQRLPAPGSPEASAMMDCTLAEYSYPSNPKNAARAGWVAAMRWVSLQPKEEPK